MHLVALTHVDNQQQTVVLWQDVANHSMARQVALLRWQLASVAILAWGQRFVVAWVEGYDFYSSRRRRRLLRASSSDD